MAHHMRLSWEDGLFSVFFIRAGRKETLRDGGDVKSKYINKNFKYRTIILNSSGAGKDCPDFLGLSFPNV